MTVRAAVLSLCALGVLAGSPAAVPADAATVTVDRTCYVPGEPIAETGLAFTPNANVVESLSLVDARTTPPTVLDELTAPAVTTDTTGAFARQMRAPALARDTDRTETALGSFTDQSNPAAPVSVRWTLSAWDIDVSAWDRGRADPRRRMRIDTYGWVLGGTLYAHYYRGTTRVARMTIGAVKGDCGTLRRTVRQFPMRAVRAGSYHVYFSTTRVLDKAEDAWIRYDVRVAAQARKATTSSTGARPGSRCSWRGGPRCSSPSDSSFSEMPTAAWPAGVFSTPGVRQ